MHIHIEGLDLAGKTTICRRLQEQCGGMQVFHNALTVENCLYEKADRLRKEGSVPDEVLGWLYYGALLQDLGTFTPRPGTTLQDSTVLLRSLAYHRATGREELAKHFASLLANHPRFDCSFVVTADRDVRLRRLEGRISRGNQAADDYLVRDQPELFNRMEQILIETAQEHFDAVLLDTGELENPQSSQDLIERILEETRKRSAMRTALEGDPLWRAAAKLASRMHRHQLRRDGTTPYIAHPMRVVLTLVRIFRQQDPVILAAALLHDVIEDTSGDYDDIAEHCSRDVADLVAALSKDPRIVEERREILYHDQLAAANWRVKLIKMSDVYDNYCDSRESNRQQQSSAENVKKCIELAGNQSELAVAKQALKDLLGNTK